MIDYTAPDKARCALLTVDAQCDYVAAQSPVRSANATCVCKPLGDLVQGFREAGKPVVHQVRLYRPDASNVDLCRRRAVEEGMRVLMPGTQGAELLPDVAPPAGGEGRLLDPYLLMDGQVQTLGPNEAAIYKPRWGGFYDTPLKAWLDERDITTLVVAGFNFPTAGRATVLEASERDYRVILVPDATAGVSEEAQRELCRVGLHLMPVDCCLNWLHGLSGAGYAGAPTVASGLTVTP